MELDQEAKAKAQSKIIKWLRRNPLHPYLAMWICGFLYSEGITTRLIWEEIMDNMNKSDHNKALLYNNFAVWYEENIRPLTNQNK